MIKRVGHSESESILLLIEGRIDRRKAFFENPTIGLVFLCGAIRGLDVPIPSLMSLAHRFGDERFYLLNQSLDAISQYELFELCSFDSGKKLAVEVNRKFPGIFTGDVVLSWGNSGDWFVIFDAQLSTGVLIVLSSDNVSAARAAYSCGDALYELHSAFTECVQYELNCFPADLRVDIAGRLFASWGVEEE